MRRTPTIRLVAMSRNDDGTESVVSIVETFGRYAAQWFRRFKRDESVSIIVINSNSGKNRIFRK